MQKTWSISTTVRNPERLRDFLKILKTLKGQEFNSDNQVKFQILLIQNRLYKPTNIPKKHQTLFENIGVEIPYKIAEETFYTQQYKDPPMRGRQSVNPLNKLGFAIARAGAGPIQITKLGEKFLTGDYDIGFIFFKSLLKLQFPNPWSDDFSEDAGFDVRPLVATMKLLLKLSSITKETGLDKTEFCVFIPTLINASQIDTQINRILQFRKEKEKEKDKDKLIRKFVEQLYGGRVEDTKLNNLLDYGDNIMRYFRLTRYFRVSMDPLGQHWGVDLEPTRLTEIKQLVEMYSGSAVKFSNQDEYMRYISDINVPPLPWDAPENLRKIVLDFKKIIEQIVAKNALTLTSQEKELIDQNVAGLSAENLQNYSIKLRAFHLNLRKKLDKKQLVSDMDRIEKTADLLRNNRDLHDIDPAQFEKLLADALKIINDEISINPNYPVDDNGEPVSHAPGNKADIEFYYKSFKGTCEVTLNTSRLQCMAEGQPIMRHLRAFEKSHGDDAIFCLFIAPKIHQDTYGTFWNAVKYEYDGVRQKIVPLTTEQFSIVLDAVLSLIKCGNRPSHVKLRELYEKIINETQNVAGYSDWSNHIQEIVEEWCEGLTA